MKTIKNTDFGGERPLFESHDVRLENVVIHAGESALKECSNIEAYHCTFEGAYPFWHVHGFHIEHCYFPVTGRSALWYCDHLVMKDTVIDAPKMFREMDHLTLQHVEINDADETFWHCSDINLSDVKLKGGTYPFMFAHNVYADGLQSDAKYVFQYASNVELHNAHIITKDAFWESDNVTIYDSVLDGEYLGWHAHHMRLVNCHISGTQVLCYAHDLVIEHCTFDPSCDRMFEYSDLEADIDGEITNIKNPRHGHIIVDRIHSITIDENIKQPADCIIEQRQG